ncbi:hypothetical protein MMC09_002835 [Bachmanniomyces sp. S44760]|nr:hypothetical protein [Bachmanniomyces sp. S44760]
MEDATISFIIELQLADLVELESNGNGALPELRKSDAELAVSLYKKDLEEAELLLIDRHIAKSIGHAAEQNDNVIYLQEEAELASAEDHHSAQRHSHGSSNGDHVRMALPEHHVNGTLPTLLSSSSKDDDHSSVLENEQGAPASSSLAKRSLADIDMVECVACQHSRASSDILVATCTHAYCHECIAELFRTSTIDEALFPPRCCKQEITFDEARHFLPTEVSENFIKKSEEFRTLDRTYCSQPDCSKFIPVGRIQAQVGICYTCLSATCAICKQAEHVDDCPEDLAMQGFLTTASANGYQRCRSCRRMVELDTGCYHITYVDQRHDLPIRSFAHKLTGAYVNMSSVISAVRHGRDAIANSGTRTISLPVLKKLLIGLRLRTIKLLSIRQSVNVRFATRLINFWRTMNANMRDGTVKGGPIGVNNVMHSCHSSYSSAVTVDSKLAEVVV